MDPALKRRLLVAIIVVALIVIFVPIPFGHLKTQKAPTPPSQIPPAPTQSAQPAKKLTAQQIAAINKGFVPAEAPKAHKHRHIVAHIPTKKIHRVEHVKTSHKRSTHPKKAAKTTVASPVVAEYSTGNTHEKSIVITQSDLSNQAPKINIRKSSLSSSNVAKTHATAPSPEVIQNHINKAKQMDQAWVAQLGSFKKPKLTEDVVTKLRKSGYTAFSYQTKVNGTTYYRVYVGPFLHVKQAKNAVKEVKNKFKITGYVHQFDATNLN